jgi:hypothetical protein
MSHIAVSNMKDGKNVDWMEQVSDNAISGMMKRVVCGRFLDVAQVCGKIRSA